MDEEESALFSAALTALKDEDRAFSECFPKDHPLKNYPNVAHGLAYWLFETTLVYFVFKAWLKLPGVTVAWEHALRQAEAERSDPDVEGRMGAHEKCDLVLLDGKGNARRAFEAKWWTNNSRKTGQALLVDAAKLRRGFDANTEKYLLTFWYGSKASDTVEADEAAAREFCRAHHGLAVLRVGAFETKLASGKDGYFALGLLKIS
jgi:hypothetical protein